MRHSHTTRIVTLRSINRFQHLPNNVLWSTPLWFCNLHHPVPPGTAALEGQSLPPVVSILHPVTTAVPPNKHVHHGVHSVRSLMMLPVEGRMNWRPGVERNISHA